MSEATPFTEGTEEPSHAPDVPGLAALTLQEVEAVVRASVATAAPVRLSVGAARVLLDPMDPGDGVFEPRVDPGTRPTDGGRRLLGQDAVAAAVGLFRAAGWSVRVADSSQRLGGSNRALVCEWLRGSVAAAVQERPALEEWAIEYLRTRRRQLADGTLRVIVHHRDVLAWPP